MRNTKHLRRRVGAWAVAATIVAGCGQASAAQPHDDASEQVGVSADVEAQIVACLEEAGFTATPPPIDEDGAYTQRLEQCVTRLGVRDEFFDEPDAAEMQAEVERQNEATVAYVQCLRNRGWQMPDPVRDNDGLLVDRKPIGVEGSQATAFDVDAQRCNSAASAMVPKEDEEETHDHGDHDHEKR